jgi:O-antigen/teichoic acid export membrane protein
MCIGLIYYFLGHMDVIMFGYFVAASEVGVYSVALKVATLVIFGLQIVLPVVRPHFSELSERGDFKTMEALFKTSTKWLLYSGLLAFALILILRLEVLNVFGGEFVVGGSILVILGLGSLANVLSGPTGQLLVMTGKQKWEMINTSLMVVFNFSLNLFLIPRMGTIGAAIATALSIFAINAAKLVEVYLLYNIHPYSAKFLKGIVAIFSGCIVCLFVRWTALEFGLGFLSIIVLAGSSFLTVTFAGMWILAFDEEDRLLFDIVRAR